MVSYHRLLALSPEPTPGDATEGRRWLMGLSSFENSHGGPQTAPQEEPGQAWTPSLLPYILGSSPRFTASHAGTFSANRDAGLLPAKSLGQGHSRVVAGPEETGTYSCMRLAVCVAVKKNAGGAVFQTNKGSGNGEGSKAPENTGYKNTISLPSGDMGLWGREASHK